MLLCYKLYLYCVIFKYNIVYNKYIMFICNMLYFIFYVKKSQFDCRL